MISGVLRRLMVRASSLRIKLGALQSLQGRLLTSSSPSTLIHALQLFKSGATSTATTLVQGLIRGSLRPPRMISARTRCTSPFTRYFLHYFFSFLFLLTSNLNHDIPEASLRTTPEASLRTTREFASRNFPAGSSYSLDCVFCNLRITPYRGTSTMM